MFKIGKKKKLKKRIAALEEKVRIIKDSVNADVIADKVSKKIFARAADEIKNPIANPFDYSANDDNT